MLNKILNLTRPLAILDCETTGLNPEVDRIFQLAVHFHYPIELGREPREWSTLFNPEIPILNSEHHGFTDEDVKDAPVFKHFSNDLARYLLDSDVGGYNVAFDISFIKAEMKRAEVAFPWEGFIIDPLQIYKIQRGHTLTNAFLEYGGENGQPTNIPFDNAHDAGADVKATEIVLRGQLLRHSNLPRTVGELSNFCFPRNANAIDQTGKFVWLGEDAAFNFGKWRGKLLKDRAVRGYLHWIANVGEFTPEVKEIAQDALDGIFPVKK
jgi:DNA polymerase-3 subunit epsilon